MTKRHKAPSPSRKVTDNHPDLTQTYLSNPSILHTNNPNNTINMKLPIIAIALTFGLTLAAPLRTSKRSDQTVAARSDATIDEVSDLDYYKDRKRADETIDEVSDLDYYKDRKWAGPVNEIFQLDTAVRRRGFG